MCKDRAKNVITITNVKCYRSQTILESSLRSSSKHCLRSVFVSGKSNYGLSLESETVSSINIGNEYKVTNTHAKSININSLLKSISIAHAYNSDKFTDACALILLEVGRGTGVSVNVRKVGLATSEMSA
ncbi:hypothetical protein NQ315_012993 [Exocentrus adspersus]|uniref:Uncharacterized protein n=1 Tax=Exocentrus adspersus TaxID=1586481 RepID=A0AAV8VSG9_9CUCU|nr:hypothetical protein NQ315_012993 [Exocentrus adspersus]